MTDFILLEDGEQLLQEDGGGLLQEAASVLNATSLSVALNHGTITQATLTATLTGNTPTFYMTADGGSNWEIVISGVLHIFTNTGVDLRWKVEGSGTTITNIKIEYE